MDECEPPRNSTTNTAINTATTARTATVQRVVRAVDVVKLQAGHRQEVVGFRSLHQRGGDLRFGWPGTE